MTTRYPIAHVIWTDSTLTTARWEDRKDVLARIDEQWAEPIHTAGFLVQQDEDKVVICAADNAANDDIGQCVVVPRHAIRSLDLWIGHPEGSK